jgi:hypothetical protein
MNCPQCGHNIDQDFGVITCPGCGSILMVDIDGNVQLSTFAQAPEQKSQSENPEIENIFDQQNQIDEGTGTVQPKSHPENFSEVIEFANSDSPSNPISYNLIIEGIDSAELKEKLKEALLDQKLKLNTELLLNSIKNGKLEIKNLNPIKTSLIVQRLGGEKLKLTWDQNVY